MNKRKFDIADFGFTEEEWAALPEDRRLHFANRARYQRNKPRLQARQREYHRKRRNRGVAEKWD